ncbi:Gfo/Idh/MocA family oxidoreductase [Pirellulaceae bacterium]|jgi:predicted dehydrogenase|nr:Gfo/Idh/MocA family oxidoreductase [Pirellulaceae bacterium]
MLNRAAVTRSVRTTCYSVNLLISMAKKTRRQFIEDSMFVTAAAVTASSAETASGHQSLSPNERLNVAVVGVRGRGNSHISAFAGRKDTHIRWICDADRDIGSKRVVETAKRQQGASPLFANDLREVLEDKSVDIVSIATPNHWHALAAIWSIQAGKDVYLEKPVSHNVSEGRRIVEAARKYGRIVQTGTQSRSNPGMQAAVDYLHANKLGKCRVARGLCYKRRKSIGAAGVFEPPKSVDYNYYLGPAPVQPVSRRQFHYDWHWQDAYGNGDLGNQGIHQMDLARWGLGINELSQNVFSYGGRFDYHDAGNTANTQVVVHDYGEQTLVFEVRGLETTEHRGAKVGVIYECENGYVVMASYSGGAAFDLDGKKIKSFKGTGDHFDNFLKAVRSRKTEDLNADILQGHLSSALCHLGNISLDLGGPLPVAEVQKQAARLGSNDNDSDTFSRTLQHLNNNNVNFEKYPCYLGRELKFDPKTELFVNDPQADQKLTRDYRAPFIVPKQGEI